MIYGRGLKAKGLRIGFRVEGLGFRGKNLGFKV
jgi:hypothetical protein